MPEQASQETASSNIFDELAWESKEIDTIDEKSAKDIYYYMQKIWGFLKAVNIFLVVVIIFALFYVSFQKSSKDINLSLFDPICSVFLWSSAVDFPSCQGVNIALAKKNTQLEDIKKNQFLKVSNIIGDLYSLENFIYSKEVSFLLNRASYRVKPLEIIVAFDALKTSFEPLEKSKLKCLDANIWKDNVLEITCEAYSSDWDKQIIWFSGDKVNSDVEGTAISIANSFINYIERSSSKFSVIDRQKVFTYDQVSGWQSAYTKKTTFVLKLAYNNNNF